MGTGLRADELTQWRQDLHGTPHLAYKIVKEWIVIQHISVLDLKVVAVLDIIWQFLS
jgi:hypothetical protein